MEELKAAIAAAAPDAEVVGKVGRRTSFEVTVNSTVIHSKLATMSFPDIEETVSIVKGVEEGKEPEKVTKMVEGGGCTIL